MSNLIPTLQNFTITNAANNEEIDVTDKFFEITSQIEYSAIVKSNNFSLLQGTHALELLNPKLDTFLLKKANYNINQELDFLSTTVIISTQLKCLVAWVGQNVSISNSILSCEYIQQILKLYTSTNSLKDLETFTKHPNLWNQITSKFSILLISLVKFILGLSFKSQIYEEEDLNTNTMNLNWFFDLSNNEIFKLTLIPNSTWNKLQEQVGDDGVNIKYFNFLKESFQILNTLSSLESIYSWDVSLFNTKKSSNFESKFENKIKQLEKIIEKLTSIELVSIDKLSPPTDCFNLNSQIIFDNQSPPKKLTINNISWNETIGNLNQLFNDVMDILKLLKSQNIIEFMEWLGYLQNKRSNVDINEINGLHIVSRVLFYSFINNVDEGENNLVLNIPNLKFDDFFWLFLKEFSLNNSKIANELSKNINSNISQQIHFYIETVSALFKEMTFLPSLNPSRQRQFKCKELKYWDLRQSETFNLEEYFKNVKFYSANEKNSYPLTLTIIYFKLKSIQEIILKSIELCLFKEMREFLSVYYQLTLISYHINNQLDKLIVNCKISRNSKSINYLMFLKHENNLLYQLSILKSNYLEILSFNGFDKLPKDILINKTNNEELLFNLQWKPFNSITDPHMLNFNEFKKRLREMHNQYTSDIKTFNFSLSEDIENCMKSFNASLTEGKLLINKLAWFDELKSIKLLNFDNLQIELNDSILDIENLQKLISQNSPFTFEIVRLTRHCYFPGFKVTEKK